MAELAELCFHRFEHFDCVPIYILALAKSSAGNQKNFTFVKFTSQFFSNADESLKEETRLVLLSDGSLVTLYTLCSYIYHLWGSQCTSLWQGTEFLKAVQWLSPVSIHHFVHFNCVLIYIFDFHHKRCASDQKDFTFVKFTSHLFSNTDESLKGEVRLLLL